LPFRCLADEENAVDQLAGMIALLCANCF